MYVNFGHCETPKTIVMYCYSQNITKIRLFLSICLNMTSFKTPPHDLPVPVAGMCPELTPPACPIEWMARPFLTSKPNQGLHVSAPPAACPMRFNGAAVFFFVYVQYVTVPMSGNSSASILRTDFIWFLLFVKFFGKKKHTVEPPPPFPLNVRYYNYSSIC